MTKQLTYLFWKDLPGLLLEPLHCHDLDVCVYDANLLPFSALAPKGCDNIISTPCSLGVSTCHHVTCIVQHKDMLNGPLYSPQCSLCDALCFVLLKEVLKGHRLDLDKDVGALAEPKGILWLVCQ